MNFFCIIFCKDCAADKDFAPRGFFVEQFYCVFHCADCRSHQCRKSCKLCVFLFDCFQNFFRRNIFSEVDYFERIIFISKKEEAFDDIEEAADALGDKFEDLLGKAEAKAGKSCEEEPEKEEDGDADEDAPEA